MTTRKISNRALLDMYPVGAVLGEDLVIATFLDGTVPTTMLERPDRTRYQRRTIEISKD